MERLRARLEAGEAVVAGVLSGTSADGIDVAIVRPGPGAGALDACLAFATRPWPGELGARVRAVLDGAEPRLRELALLHRDLGRACGAAAREVADASGLALDLVGSHGQTVWHHDAREPSGPATLQLGDGDQVAEAAGCPAVSDFRQRDVAAGGEGAPLVALVDELMFPDLERPAAVLNLGGMANLTVLHGPGVAAPPGADLEAYDTGPAGSLLDGLARAALGEPFDRGGSAALEGRARPELVAELLGHPFLRKEPPKSTGRDTFGASWVEDVRARAAELDPPLTGAADLLATGVEFVARSVADALGAFGPAGLRRVVLCGGGVHNRALVAALERCLAPCLAPGGAVVGSAALGIEPDAREAIGFALLAARTALGLPSTHPGATGARAGRCLGKLSP